MPKVRNKSAGIVIASLDKPPGAGAFVDDHSGTGFPVDDVSIVVRDVYTVERGRCLLR